MKTSVKVNLYDNLTGEIRQRAIGRKDSLTVDQFVSKLRSTIKTAQKNGMTVGMIEVSVEGTQYAEETRTEFPDLKAALPLIKYEAAIIVNTRAQALEI